MRRKPSPSTTTGEVDRQLDNTAYDNVVIVKNNIESVVAVAMNIGSVVELVDDLPAIHTVADNIVDVVAVGDNISDVVLVSDVILPELSKVVVVAGNIGSVVATANSIAEVNVVAADLQGTAFSAIEDLGSITESITVTPGTGQSNIEAVADNIVNVNLVATSVVPNMAAILDADNQAWIATAAKMTADSYATEAEDVYVKVYTSNGDGTYASADTAEYSALHHAAKSGTVLGTLIDDTEPKIDKTYSSVKVDSELNDVLQTVLALNTYSAQGQMGGTTPVSLTTTEQVLPFNAVTQSTDVSQFEIGTNTVTIKSAGTYSFLSTVVFEDNVNDGLVGTVTFNLRDTTTDALYYTQSTGIEITGFNRDSIAFNSLMVMPTSGAYPLTFDINVSIAGATGIANDYSIVEVSSVISKQGGSVLTGSDIIALINATPNYTLDMGGI